MRDMRYKQKIRDINNRYEYRDMSKIFTQNSNLSSFILLKSLISYLVSVLYFLSPICLFAWQSKVGTTGANFIKIIKFANKLPKSTLKKQVLLPNQKNISETEGWINLCYNKDNG